MMSDPFEGATYDHHVGQFVGFKPGWWCFSDMVDADGGRMTMGEVGPFASREAAAICATMATAEQVEEISDDLVRRARKAYLSRVLQ